MPAHFDRALLLFDQSRYDLAEQELRQALGEEPNDPAAHALLAMCLSRRKDHAGAIETAERAVGLAPDLAFAHYALANALHFADRESEAAVAIDQAINLDPLNSSFHGMQASIRFARRDWAGALESADAGLRLDPQDDACTNLRAMALVQLGRRDEAGAAIQGALERDP
jgi:predicted Zn-dependent protease